MTIHSIQKFKSTDSPLELRIAERATITNAKGETIWSCSQDEADQQFNLHPFQFQKPLFAIKNERITLYEYTEKGYQDLVHWIGKERVIKSYLGKTATPMILLGLYLLIDQAGALGLSPSIGGAISLICALYALAVGIGCKIKPSGTLLGLEYATWILVCLRSFYLYLESKSIILMLVSSFLLFFCVTRHFSFQRLRKA